MVTNPLKYDNIFALIGAFIPVIISVVGVSLLGYMLFGAYLWLTSSGDPEKLQKAQKTLVNAVIGFVLFGVMFLVFFFLSGVLGIEWTNIFSAANI